MSEINYGAWARNEQDDPQPDDSINYGKWVETQLRDFRPFARDRFRIRPSDDIACIRERIEKASQTQTMHMGEIRAYLQAITIAFIEPDLQAIYKGLVETRQRQVYQLARYLRHQYNLLEAAREYEAAHTTRSSGKLNRHERARLDIMRIIERLAGAAMDGAFADM